MVSARGLRRKGGQVPRGRGFEILAGLDWAHQDFEPKCQLGKQKGQGQPHVKASHWLEMTWVGVRSRGGCGGHRTAGEAHTHTHTQPTEKLARHPALTLGVHLAMPNHIFANAKVLLLRLARFGTLFIGMALRQD